MKVELQNCIVFNNRTFIVGDGIKVWTNDNFYKGRLCFINYAMEQITLDCSEDYKSNVLCLDLEYLNNVEPFPNADTKKEFIKI